MIIQLTPPTSTEILVGILALIVTIIMIGLFLGTFLYFFTIVYRFKEKTEGSEKFFWLRSFILAIITVLIIYGVSIVFNLLLFSPFFYLDIPEKLMNAVQSVDIRGIIASLSSTPTTVLILFIIMIVMIVAILSYLMVGIYKVSYGWTTLLTWSAIGIFLIIDILISWELSLNYK